MSSTCLSRCVLLVGIVSVTLAAVVPATSAGAAASISLTATTVVAGQTIAVSGLGFKPNVLVAVFATFRVGTTSRSTVVTPGTSGSGAFTTSFPVPAGAVPGGYSLTAADFQGDAVSRSLTVVPGLPLGIGTASPQIRTVVAGHSVAVQARGFKSGETVKVSVTFPLYAGGTQSYARTATAGRTGETNLLLQVPNGATKGSYLVVAVGGSGTATGKVAVVYQPFIYASTRSAAPGRPFTVYGGGFVPGSSVRLRMTVPRSDAQVETLVATVDTDVNGSFSTSFAPPADAALQRDPISASDVAHDLRAGITIGLQPSIQVRPAHIAPGQVLAVVGSGFGPNAPVTVSFTVALIGGGTRAVSTSTTSGATGSISAVFGVPGRAASGPVTVQASGPSRKTSTSLRISLVAPQIALTPTAVLPGGTVKIGGTHFLAGDRVAVGATLTRADGSPVTVSATVTISGAGTFTATLQIPADVTPGSYLVAATSATAGRVTAGSLRIAAATPTPVAVPTAAPPSATPTGV